MNTAHQFTSEGGLYITLEFLDGMAAGITIQEKEGKVLFDGNYVEAEKLVGALYEALHFSNRPDRKEVIQKSLKETGRYEDKDVIIH